MCYLLACVRRRDSFFSRRAVWSYRMLVGQFWCNPELVGWPRRLGRAFHIVWSRFRQLRRFLAYRFEQVFRVLHVLHCAFEGCLGCAVRCTCFARLLLIWRSLGVLLSVAGPGTISLLCGCSLALGSMFVTPYSKCGGFEVALDLVRCAGLVDFGGTLQLLSAYHLRKGKICCYAVL